MLPNLRSCMRMCPDVPKCLNSRGTIKCLSSEAGIQCNPQSGGRAPLTSKMGSVLLNAPCTAWYSYSLSNSLLGETIKLHRNKHWIHSHILGYAYPSPPNPFPEKALSHEFLEIKRKKKKVGAGEEDSGWTITSLSSITFLQVILRSSVPSMNL